MKVGLEIHVQLNTKHKLFSLSRNCPTEEANTEVSFFDLGLPGTQPKLNPEALLLALKAAHMLQSQVQPISTFDRKHYFYQDQPLGYQITQHFRPIARGGQLHLFQDQLDIGGPSKTINIEQIQIEQDTGKSAYDGHRKVTEIDYNRANVPLIEVVTKPDFENLDQVKGFVKKFIDWASYYGICTGNLESGAMRMDLNVSVNNNPRVEVKNLASTSELSLALKYEYERQMKALKDGEPIEQETRWWNATKTVRARSKEDAVDYRYFPDPELPAIRLKEGIEKEVAAAVRISPTERIYELNKSGLEMKYAKHLVHNDDLFQYYNRVYEKVVTEENMTKHSNVLRTVNNWVVHELPGAFKRLMSPVDLTAISSGTYADITLLILNGELTASSAKLLLQSLIEAHLRGERAASVDETVKRLKLKNPSKLTAQEASQRAEEVLAPLLAQHPGVAQKIRQGNTNSINFFIGLGMKATKGTFDTKVLKSKLHEMLGVSKK